MKILLQDLRYGLRVLIKKPGFTAVAVLTLALGIGATTAIFSIVNSVLLRPLPYRKPDQLMVLFGKFGEDSRDTLSYPDFKDYQEQNQVLESIAAFQSQSVNLTGGDQPDRVRGGFVSADYFKVFNLEATLGRTFAKGEDQPGGERVVVVSEGLWQRRLNSDPKLDGKTLILNGEPYSVIGVLPQKFQPPLDPDIEVWMPAPRYPGFQPSRAARYLWGVGRIKSGVSLAQAQAEIGTIAKRIAEAYPNENAGRGVELISMQELLIREIRPALLVLLGAVALILLIACANVANLLLARGAARQKEMAVRAALGAGRWRLARQLLTETLLLSLLGGGLGLLLAVWGVDALLALNPNALPGNRTVNVDGQVFLFAFAISILTGILFGLVPALQLAKPELHPMLKEGGRTTGEGAGWQRVRGLFVISQVALSLMLLIGGGLLIKSFYRLIQVDPGFKPENLLTMEYRLPRNKYRERGEQWNFHRQVVERLKEVPGVKSAALIRGLPLTGNGGSVGIVLPGQALPPKGKEPQVSFNTATLEYFETIGIPFIKGRLFTDQDQGDAPMVFLINQTMARKFWPGEDPIGKQIQIPEDNLDGTIIGVVGDAKHYWLSEEQQPQIYASYSQMPGLFATIVVKTAVEPMSLSTAVREAVWRVDKDQPMWKVRTVEYLLDWNVADKRFVMLLMSIFAGLALALTVIGLYGVISYAVSQRTHEIGIRMALGAQAGDIFRMVLRQGIKLILIGTVIGLIAAFSLTRLLASLLYAISATDPVVYVSLSLLLAGIALLACYIPARRATRVDPMIALRYE